jgi:hypothetical protein
MEIKNVPDIWKIHLNEPPFEVIAKKRRNGYCVKAIVD